MRNAKIMLSNVQTYKEFSRISRNQRLQPIHKIKFSRKILPQKKSSHKYILSIEKVGKTWLIFIFAFCAKPLSEKSVVYHFVANDLLFQSFLIILPVQGATTAQVTSPYTLTLRGLNKKWLFCRLIFYDLFNALFCENQFITQMSPKI